MPDVAGDDGKKLSKRHGAQSLDEFRDMGYYAPALMNFLALLGWSYDDKTTIMSRDELIERFSFDRVQPSPAAFDYKKLDWMNGVYLRALLARRVRARADRVPRPELGSGQGAADRAARAGEARAPRRVSALGELLLPDDVEPEDPSLLDPEVLSRRVTVLAAARRPGTPASIEAALRGLADELGAEAGPGVPADPDGRDGIEDLARALREPRAARPRRVAQAPESRGRRSGLGGPSGSSARWNCSHARFRKEALGVGSRSLDFLGRCLPRPSPPSSRFTFSKCETPARSQALRAEEHRAGDRAGEGQGDEQPKAEQRRDEHEPGADADRDGREERRAPPVATPARASATRTERGRSSRDAGETHAEQRAAPFPHERRRRVEPAVSQRLGDLRRQLARLGERFARAPRERARPPAAA